MATARFVQLDVFTTEPFAGNPVAVFQDAAGLTDELMLKIAREMNLSETVFVLPARNDQTLRRLRIFTPVMEIPFAGHPVVGTWNALAREGTVAPPESGSGWINIQHEVGIGNLPVAIEFRDSQVVQVVMTQGKFEILEEVDDGQEQAEIARALGRDREDLDETLPIQTISTGLPILAVPVRSLADLRTCRINAALLSSDIKEVLP